MDKYYYFASELPLLKFTQATYIKRDYFLQEAGKWLSSKDFMVLSGADINDVSLKNHSFSVLIEYKIFERGLRDELRLWREALRTNRECAISPDLRKALTQGNPLDIEKNLLQLRWNFIEEKEEGHYFDLEFLILYFLKVQIIERLFTFNKEKGMAKFEKLCEVHL